MDNSLLNIFIIFVSLIGIASAIYVVAQTNVFRAAIALALSFMTVAVVFFAINAEFLGSVQILVYIGAVSIVNAIAIGKGSTLGIDTFVETTLTKKEGKEIGRASCRERV